MNKNEFGLIVAALTTAYPNSKFLSEKTSLELWYRMLGDLEYKVVENAVMECIATKTFPPSIAEIRNICMERITPSRPTVDEAWGTVLKAISRYGYCRPDEAFAMMDDITLSIVKNFGWINLCKSENPTADRANFRMAYETKIEKLNNTYKLPKLIAEEKNKLQEHYLSQISKLSENIKLLE